MFSYLSKILCVFTFCFFSVACTFAQDTNSNTNTNSTPSETTTIVDYSSYFKGINGTAIFYTPENNHYTVYNQSLSEKRSSPCSTFKIFSTYVGLSSHKLDPNNSTRKWNGTIYWNSDWHRDIDLTTAFKTSCVWYYRQLTNDIGPDIMQEYIDKFDYGNKDISDWYGETDPDDDPMDLKGFWIETSLKVSPKEQVQILNKIFTTTNDEYILTTLKDLMLTYTDDTNNLKIYGKTGYGVVNDENADAWFVGMYEYNSKVTYFAVRLDDPKNPQALSSTAKEIAINIIKNLNK